MSPPPLKPVTGLRNGKQRPFNHCTTLETNLKEGFANSAMVDMWEMLLLDLCSSSGLLAQNGSLGSPDLPWAHEQLPALVTMRGFIVPVKRNKSAHFTTHGCLWDAGELRNLPVGPGGLVENPDLRTLPNTDAHDAFSGIRSVLGG